jgi:hypothetical protein
MSVCTGGDRNNSLNRGFVGFAALSGHRGYCLHDGGGVLIGHQGCGALIQEDPPLVFLVDVRLGLLLCHDAGFCFFCHGIGLSLLDM